ncbi:MAG: hypothetical protein IKE76_16275, partial [Clostridia bacterium]|nr:hypothetical protein [Clostridia bacterium]
LEEILRISFDLNTVAIAMTGGKPLLCRGGDAPPARQKPWILIGRAPHRRPYNGAIVHQP